jgi:hypothetical protein
MSNNNNKRDTSIIYFLLGIYAVLINWHYNHNIILAIICYIFWPIYLIYAILHGDLAHGAWKTIPLSYFK